MANGKPKPKRRRRQTGTADTVLIPFRIDELKGLVLEKMGTARNKGGRPKTRV
jgi:hypothetical protein